MADWLSEKRVVVEKSMLKSYWRSKQSHRASFMACVAAIYSDSVVNSKTIFYCLVDYEIVLVWSINTYLEIVWQSLAIILSVSV